jgi:hypothetical protein
MSRLHNSSLEFRDRPKRMMSTAVIFQCATTSWSSMLLINGVEDSAQVNLIDATSTGIQQNTETTVCNNTPVQAEDRQLTSKSTSRHNKWSLRDIYTNNPHQKKTQAKHYNDKFLWRYTDNTGIKGKGRHTDHNSNHRADVDILLRSIAKIMKQQQFAFVAVTNACKSSVTSVACCRTNRFYSTAKWTTQDQKNTGIKRYVGPGPIHHNDRNYSKIEVD